MSGVFGIVDSRRHAPIERRLSDMGRAMTHRAWHVVETHCASDGRVGLGRVGIGLFNAGPQPARSEDGSLIVFLSGELYDTSELRRELETKGYRFRDNSDLELILRLYQDQREQFIDQIDGMFVLAIWDHGRQELIVANDRAGLYPLYYAHVNGRLIVAPEMKAILNDPGFRKEIDLTALAEYARFQYLLGDKTFFEDIRLLPGASLLVYDAAADQLATRRYWDVGRIAALPASITLDEAADEAGRLLKAAVERLSGGPHRLGVYLSGGLDSRAILGFMDRRRVPVTTLTYGLRQSRDAHIAPRIAAAAGTPHHYFEFTDGNWVKEHAGFHLDLTEGFHSWIHAHGISLLNEARSLMDVNLTGYHGAELNWDDPLLYHPPDDTALTSRLFEQLAWETTWPSLSAAEERLVFAPGLANRLAGRAFDSFRAELAQLGHLPPHLRVVHLSAEADRRLYLYYAVFHRSHIEFRFPFCDYRYLEFIYALPPEMNLKRTLRRAIIAKWLPRLARIPYDKDGLPVGAREPARLTAGLMKRSKAYVNRHVARLFGEYAPLHSDYENWLRGELRGWGEELLLGERTLQRGLFNPDFLRSIWRRTQSGREADIIGKLAPLMTVEMMLRRYFDGAVSDAAAQTAGRASRAADL